jgi:3-methyladenine DNA glycosylase AlkD
MRLVRGGKAKPRGAGAAEIRRLAAEVRAQIRPGARTTELRALRRAISRQIATLPGSDVRALALALFGHDLRTRFIAYELLYHHREALAGLGRRDIIQLGRGMDSWDAVDMFGCLVSGPTWREHQVSEAFIHAWARSNDRWRRRAALVSTVPLNSKARGGRGDAERTLAVCRLLIEDRDDMVVKALSWALRELSKRDPASVQRFLREHEASLAPRVRREVRSKLSTGLKNPRRRSV